MEWPCALLPADRSSHFTLLKPSFFTGPLLLRWRWRCSLAAGYALVLRNRHAAGRGETTDRRNGRIHGPFVANSGGAGGCNECGRMSLSVGYPHTTVERMHQATNRATHDFRLVGTSIPAKAIPVTTSLITTYPGITTPRRFSIARRSQAAPGIGFAQQGGR